MKVLIVHDFDHPLFTRKTCLKRAFWLVMYVLFGWSTWIRSRIPKWLLYEKYSQAKAIALLDKTLKVDSVFGIRREVREVFPKLQSEIEEIGGKVTEHYHLQKQRKGAMWKSRGAWKKYVDYKKHYMTYDRHFVLENEKVIPKEGTSVAWHIDHMSYNLYYYIQFLVDVLGVSI